MTSQFDLVTEFMDATENMTTDEVKAKFADKSSDIYRYGRLFRRYHRAYKAAENFGYVGVGCITFAEERLAIFRRRTGL